MSLMKILYFWLMLFSDKAAADIARKLLQIKAIQLNPSNPFTWASGWRSPIYCDNRKLLSYPVVRTKVKDGLAQLIEEKFAGAELIAGVATAGIPHGVLVAEQLGLPFAYVRSRPKGHGLANQIEGVIIGQPKTVVVEDLISTGGSSLRAVEALRAAGSDIMGLAAVFTYGFDVAQQAFEKAGCPFFTLSDYASLLEVGLAQGAIEAQHLDLLKAWRASPQTWEPQPAR